MTGISERGSQESPSPFAGLRPHRFGTDDESPAAHTGHPESSRIARSLFATVPIVLVGSIALAGMNLGASELVSAKPQPKPKSETADLGVSIKNALASANAAARPAVAATPVADPELSVAAVAPSNYQVQSGDTVSGIAGRYGLSTASVLARNGLGWKSIIFPGQVLKLTNAVVSSAVAASAAPVITPASASSTRYTIVRGDTISSIAARFGVTVSAVLSANGLAMTSIIYAGRTLTIPSSSAPSATAVVAMTPVVSTAPAAGSPTGSYTIKSGDTMSAIAARFGVSISSLLSANGLSLSSIIYSGRTLAIPGAAAVAPAASPTVQPAQSGSTVTPLSSEMRANALTIVRVGESLGSPPFGIIVALAAAMQESGLRNIDYGDQDSVGLFQQRPSAGWGTPAQLLNTTYASRLFYGGADNPNAPVTRGLLDIPNWQSMTVTQAAQAVEISAFPNGYAQWEASARAWYAALK
jgi:LysM repeat protein